MLNIYETVYGLSADPFRLSPDYRFSYSHPSYARSKAYLDYALIQGEGFVMITGGPGTGKTTLVREILANIDIAHTQVATLTSTQLRTRDLLQMVATAFGLRFEDSDKATLLTALEQSLQQQHRDGRRAVLIVDEAQGLSIDALEELRQLANLQSGNQMLMQVFLLGQDKLRDLINSPKMEQLRQRVVASSLLEPLDLDETVNYVEHRLNQAGWQGDPEIGGEALQLVHKYSGGVPRLINLICTRLLLSGGLSDKHAFDGQDARDVILELKKEMLIDSDAAEIKVDDAVDVRSLGPSTRDSTREEENTDADQSGQRPPSRNSTGSAGKVSLRNSASNRIKKKRNKGREQKLSAPVEYEIEAAIEDYTALPEEERAQILPFSEGKDEKSGRSGDKSSITKRSIAMATARAAARSVPISRGRKPGEHKAAAGTARHNNSSLKMQFIIFLLAIGSLTAVAGVKFRDYAFTVSVQADKQGMIRRVVPGIKNMGEKVDELVVINNID
jgi:type II secretory pathway predicted ATPase ExeA